MNKVLFCGLGSIGQRHVRIIKDIDNTIEMGAFRSRNIDIVIPDNLQSALKISPEEYYGLKIFYNYEDALNWSPDAVFITNPISLHIETAIAAAEHGCNIFIEKPLDSSNKNVDKLLKLVKKKKLICMIGYQLRYHPANLKIKELIINNEIGNLVAADMHFGEWLPGMHPYEDYRNSHASLKEQGGGVILCLSHMIDLSYWLFGLPKSVYSLGGHLSTLEVNVEDTADILMNCTNHSNNFPLHIHLDFLQKPKKCFVHLIGDKGSIFFDFCTNRLEINILNKNPVIKVFDDFNRNDMFISEMNDFIESIDTKKKSKISLKEGADVLSICLAAKKSLISGNVEYIK